MKMKKPSSMATILSRTCPHCFTMVDPVWYGWHVSKCTSSLKQDMATSDTHNKIEVDNPQLVASANGELSSSLHAACTLSFAPDSEVFKEIGSDENTNKSLEVIKHEVLQLRAEKQALADIVKDLEFKLEQLEGQYREEKQALAGRVKDLELELVQLEGQHGEEKQALANKVKDLELAVEGLKCQLRLSRKSERKVASLVELSHNGSRDVLDLGDCSDHLRQQDVDTVPTKTADITKAAEVDHIVDLAYVGLPMSHGFLPQVDGLINTHKTPLQLSVGANDMDHGQDGAEKCPRVSATPVNGSPSLVVHYGERYTAPKDALGTPFNCGNGGSLNSCEVDKHGGAKLDGDSSIDINDCGPVNLDVHGASIDMQVNVLDKDASNEKLQVPCKEKSHAKQVQLHSQSSNSNLDVQVVKAKPGLRRVVLSDSESEDGNMQVNCQGGGCVETGPGIFTNLCNSRNSNIAHTSTRIMDEHSNDSSADIRVSDIHKVGQSSPPRMKEIKVVQSSNQFDNATGNGVIDQSSPNGAQELQISALHLGRAGVNVVDEEHTGLRRSKRLRRQSTLKSQNKELDMPLSKKKLCCQVLHGSRSMGTSSSTGGFESEATSNIHTKAVKITFEGQHKVSSKKKSRHRLEVVCSSSSETGDHMEGFREFRPEAITGTDNKAVKITGNQSERCLRAQKRLFADVESRPLYGKHSTDSEEEDSEMESDSDSLKNFIVESEGTQVSQSCNDDESSSQLSHSSRDAYCDLRLQRDLKIRNYVWELEAEMLSAFAVKPELCLRAVCAINRRQTEDEQREKVSKYMNKRGFDKPHAERASLIAEFLTNGDPSGPVKKSVEDLQKFNAGALELCKMLAAKHSKQLFEIYMNTEDPHFPFA